MNMTLIKIGVTLFALGTFIAFILVATARGQTEDQNIANINELSQYMSTLSAFTTACTNAPDNQAIQAACTQIENEEHDILKPFMDQNKELMAKVIVGP